MFTHVKCPYCNGAILLSDRGEYVCSSCGTVLGVEYVWGRKESVDPSGPYISINEVVRRSHRMSSVEVLDRANRLLKTKKLMVDPSGRDRGLDCIVELCRILGIDCRRVVENYTLLFRRLYERGGLTRCKVAVATLIYSIFTGSVNLRLSDVLNAYERLGKRLGLSDLATITNLLNLRYSPSDRVRSIIASIVDKLNCNDKMRVVKAAMDRYAKLPRRVVIGKNPYTLAAALVYLSANEGDCRTEVKELAEYVKVSRITLREYVQKIQPYS